MFDLPGRLHAKQLEEGKRARERGRSNAHNRVCMSVRTLMTELRGVRASDGGDGHPWQLAAVLRAMTSLRTVVLDVWQEDAVSAEVQSASWLLRLRLRSSSSWSVPKLLRFGIHAAKPGTILNVITRHLTFTSTRW